MSSPSPPSPPLSTATTTTTATPSTDAILAVAAPNAVLSTPTPPPRKFPAPCWTQEETVALITTYQDKWYSLRRRNLRTADWDAVAEEVNLRCPNQSPDKSSAQCRHKMEKLRKRYRTEKQRLSSLPNNGINGRFFGSNWVFFDFIHNMELGSGGSIDINLLNNNNNNININNINNNNHHVVGRVDLDVKPFSMNHNNNGGSNNDNKKGDLGKYFDEIMMGMSGGSGGSNNVKGKSQNREFDVRSQNVAAPHIKFKVKDHHRSNNSNYVGDGLTDDFEEGEEEGEGYSSGGRRGMMGQPAGGGYKRKLGSYESRLGSKGKDSVVGEMVASIRMLGEGMVKMETMKMEMMRDIEKMRMEMEMKRSEMILESQHLIVNAFVQGLKKKSKKVHVMEID